LAGRLGGSRKSCRGDNGLPVAEAAVAGTDGTVTIDLEAFLFETGAQQTCKTTVVHAAAGKRNLPNPRSGSRSNRSANKGGGNAGVKARGNTRTLNASTQIFKQLAPQRSGRNLQRLARGPISTNQFQRIAGIEIVGLVNSQTFKLDGSLRLVINLVATENDRGHRVE